MQVFGPPTIDVATFGVALKGSPVLAERPAAEYYRLVSTVYGIDPAFMLAMFAVESDYGKAASAVVSRYGTKNWGNTRTPRKVNGVPPTIVPTDRGYFVKYPTWLASLDDACYRLGVAPYAPNARTVETIIPIWSPDGDQDNNSAAYVAAVLALMRGWQTSGKAPMQYADSTQIITPGSNRPGTKLRGFHAFVIHETDNEAAGAGAQMHHDWLQNSRPDASFHFVADAGKSIQLLPTDELGWHIGDGADDPIRDEAFYTVGIEVCVNSRSGFPAACLRAAKVVARVLHDKGRIPVIDFTVRKHGSYWSTANPGIHTGCPKHLKAGDWGVTWVGFFAMIQNEYAALDGAVKILTPAVLPTDPGFPGALQPDGSAQLGSVSFGGEAVCVEEVTVQVRNATGQRYRRTWAGYSLRPWEAV